MYIIYAYYLFILFSRMIQVYSFALRTLFYVFYFIIVIYAYYLCTHFYFRHSILFMLRILYT